MKSNYIKYTTQEGGVNIINKKYIVNVEMHDEFDCNDEHNWKRGIINIHLTEGCLTDVFYNITAYKRTYEYLTKSLCED